MSEYYLRVNLLLAAGYGLYCLVGKLGRPSARLRWGQLLLLACFVLPVFSTRLPSPVHVTIPSPAHDPFPEGPIAEIASKRDFSAVTATTSPAPVDTRWPMEEIGWLLFSLAALTAACRRTRDYLRLRRLLHNATILRTFGRVSLVISEQTSVPFSARLAGRAWVVVPEAMLARWSDLQIAVRHELQHHRQGDTRWALVIEWLIVFCFPNPAIHLWKRAIAEAQEVSCDAALIGHKISFREYASCLVRVAEAALGTRRALAGTAGMATDSRDPRRIQTFLQRRIDMMGNQKYRGRLALPALGTLSLMGLAALAGAATVTKTLQTDPAIQAIADQSLREAIKRYRASLGIVVVSDPQNGRVLAVANQDEVETQAERTPHWALSRQIEPGSLAKTIVAAAAIAAGATRVDETHDCEKGKFQFAGRQFKDWMAFDKLTTAEALLQSSNVCGLKIGMKLGKAGVEKAVSDFGFGPGGVADGFPEARPGEFPDPKAMDPDRYLSIVSTGYENIHASPLELVQAYGAIANGGRLLKPRIGEGSATEIRRVLPKEVADQMKTVLADVMVKGTAKDSASTQYRLAGKTATGYSRTHVGHDTLGGESNLASFIGFAPVDNPRVVIYVAIENPTDKRGVHGSAHAAPVFKEVAERTLRHLGVPKSSR